MLKKLENIDAFARNIIIVFAGASLVNFFNLLYQLLIAHKLTPSDFAAFNTLLSIFTVVSAPLATMQVAVTKYSVEFNSRHQISRLKFLLLDLLRKSSFLAIATFLIFLVASTHIMQALKISSLSSGYILAALVALSWLNPIFTGIIQGLEFFGWLSWSSVVSGALKLALAYIFILFGYSISGALGALLISSIIGIIIFYFPLKKIIFAAVPKERIDYREMLVYLFPVAVSYFCFFVLVNSDMILVKVFFKAEDAGLYSLAQTVGKIFLFLPGAINMVMFPKTSGLNARNMDTLSTLKRSLLYVWGLCIVAFFFYNLFPFLVLKVLTGKVYPEPVFLGRLFGISMSFFTSLLILISYFLSIKDLRFINYLILFTLLQILSVILFHRSLMQVQLALCVNAILLFGIHLFLAYRKNTPSIITVALAKR